MKPYVGLLLFGIACTACSQTNAEPDQGNPPSDLSGSGNDLGAVVDLGSEAGPGTWTTLALVAGGLGGGGHVDDIGRAARFRSPMGMTLDGAGDLYVADSGTQTVRKVVLATGAVSTVAGSPNIYGNSSGVGNAGLFYGLQGVALDGAGNLNGDYGSAYIGRLKPTSRRQNHGAYL
jgi:hypothetical protein